MERIKIKPNFTTTQEKAFEYLFDNTTNEILFGGGAGGGKTYLGVSWLIIICVKYSGIRCLMGRSKLDNLKKTTLYSFYEVCQKWGLIANKHYKFNGSSNIITFFNGSEIILKDLFHYPSDPNYDSLGSLEISAAFLDEASEIQEKAKQIVSSRIRYRLDEYDMIPKILMTCNPAKNWVYTEFYRRHRDNTLPDYRKFIQSLVQDNEYISKHYKGQLERLDEVSKARLLFGDWEYDTTSDSLIEYDNIIDVFDNLGKRGDKYITCDVARFGEDKSVIMLWDGLQVERIITYNKNTITELADRIKEVQMDNEVLLNNIIVDSDGVGGGVADILRCKNFVNNSTPINKENYRNLKTQCYYILSEKINKKEIGISISDITIKKRIIQELEQVRRKDIDKDQKLSIIGKDVVKSILGRSPDYSDALMMRMYYECNRNTGKYFIR